MLVASGIDAPAAGNVGSALSEHVDCGHEAVVVEVSSFQPDSARSSTRPRPPSPISLSTISTGTAPSIHTGRPKRGSS